jgi:hypothetical protein
VYRHVPHEYRDAATLKQRALDEVLAAEGPSHRRYRGRHALPTPRLALPEDCRVLLQSWRDRAEFDVTRPEVEVRLRELEAAA